MNLIRFIGVFAPNSQHREEIIIHKKNKKSPTIDIRTEGEKRVAMNWARRLKRAFHIDIDLCERCGGYARVIASIEDPVIIKKILSHLNIHPASNQLMLPINRAPPITSTS